MDEGYFVPRTEILTWLNNLLNVHYNQFSLIWPKFNSLDLAQYIAKSSMWSILVKSAFPRSTGRQEMIMNSSTILKFSRTLLIKLESRGMWKCKNLLEPNIKIIWSSSSGSKDISTLIVEKEVITTNPMKEGGLQMLISLLLKKMLSPKPIMGLELLWKIKFTKKRSQQPKSKMSLGNRCPPQILVSLNKWCQWRKKKKPPKEPAQAFNKK